MKKLLFFVMALLVSGALLAQGSKGKMTSKSFLAFHGGPSFAMGDFGSNNENNEKAGFAKTGFVLGLNYGYQFNKNIGLGVAAFYNRYNLDKTALTTLLPGFNVDHWQFYGMSAGPVFTHAISNKVSADLRIMGGVANANTPQFTYEGELLVKEDWSWAALFQGGINLRFDAGSNIFIFTNADYVYMRPEFKLTSGGFVVDRRYQTITAINLTGGVGIKF